MKTIMKSLNKKTLCKTLILYFIIFVSVKSFSQTFETDTVTISLSTAMSEAVANNLLLKKTAASVKASQAGLRQSESEFLPQIDLNFNYGYLDIVPGFKSILLGNIEHDLFPNITISQPLYTGGKLKYAKKVSEAELRSTELSFISQQLNLKLSVAYNYNQLQLLVNQKKILLENQKQLKIQQQYARLLVEAGYMSQLELDRISMAIATNEGSILKIDNNYQTVSFETSLLMGKEKSEFLVPHDSLQLLPFEKSLNDVMQTALDNNPVWQQLQWEINKTQARLGIQKAERQPQLTAQAYYGYEFGLESFSLDKNKRYFWGINAKMPLFDGGVTSAKIDKAKAELEQIQWQREYYQKSLFTQIQNTIARLEENKEQITIQQLAIEYAQKSYQMAMIEYHAGRRSNTDLLDIQRNLLNNQLLLNQSIVDHNTIRVQLLALMGTL